MPGQKGLASSDTTSRSCTTTRSTTDVGTAALTDKLRYSFPENASKRNVLRSLNTENRCCAKNEPTMRSTVSSLSSSRSIEASWNTTNWRSIDIISTDSSG